MSKWLLLSLPGMEPEGQPTETFAAFPGPPLSARLTAVLVYRRLCLPSSSPFSWFDQLYCCTAGCASHGLASLTSCTAVLQIVASHALPSQPALTTDSQRPQDMCPCRCDHVSHPVHMAKSMWHAYIKSRDSGEGSPVLKSNICGDMTEKHHTPTGWNCSSIKNRQTPTLTQIGGPGTVLKFFICHFSSFSFHLRVWWSHPSCEGNAALQEGPSFRQSSIRCDKRNCSTSVPLDLQHCS